MGVLVMPVALQYNLVGKWHLGKYACQVRGEADSNVFNPITVSDIDEPKILLLCASKPDSCHEPGFILVAW